MTRCWTSTRITDTPSRQDCTCQKERVSCPRCEFIPVSFESLPSVWCCPWVCRSAYVPSVAYLDSEGEIKVTIASDTQLIYLPLEQQMAMDWNYFESAYFRLINTATALKTRVQGGSYPEMMYATPRNKIALKFLDGLTNLLSELNELYNQHKDLLNTPLSVNDAKRIKQLELLKSTSIDKHESNVLRKAKALSLDTNYEIIKACKCILAAKSNSERSISLRQFSTILGPHFSSLYNNYIIPNDGAPNKVESFNNLIQIIIDNFYLGQASAELQADKCCLDAVIFDLSSEVTAIQAAHRDYIDKLIVSPNSRVQLLINKSVTLCDGVDRAMAIANKYADDIEGLFIAAEETLILSILPSIKLNNLDQELIAEWIGAENISNEYWRTAMSSARLAEKSLIFRLASLRKCPIDLSILQINQPNDERWIQADIQMAEGAWDVKNARRSFSSKSTYSEHCVPTFKIARGLGNVSIAGVLSPYPDAVDEPEKMQYEIHHPINTRNLDTRMNARVWLGIVDKRKIDALQKGFDECSEYLSIDFRNVDTHGKYLPPWIFDYPSECYSNRDLLLLELQKRYEREALCIPIGLAAVLGVIKIVDSRISIQKEALRLQQRIQKLGLSRPVLFLHVLERFCESIHLNLPFNAEAIRKCLTLKCAVQIAEGSVPLSAPMPSKSAWNSESQESQEWAFLASRPLGVADPLKTIHRLIDVLAETFKKCRTEVNKFRTFRLAGPGILRGIGVDGNETTILAYCGGWRNLGLVNKKGVRCGTNPLHLGLDISCPRCRRLICHNCGFCSNNCPILKSNQDKAIEFENQFPLNPEVVQINRDPSDLNVRDVDFPF